jgi:hypothetical protein
MNEEQRRLTYLCENVEQLNEEKSSLESLHNLRISKEEEAIEILRRLRDGTDAQTLSQSIQAGRTLAQVSRPTSEGKNISRVHKGNATAFPCSGTPSSSTGYPDIHAQLVASIARASLDETEEIVRRIRLYEDGGNILHAVQGGTLLQPLESSGIYSGGTKVFADALQTNIACRW